jgi:hypothetical protein
MKLNNIKPKIPVENEMMYAVFTDILPDGKGRFMVLDINLSSSFSIIWLKPLEEAVTKKPPTVSKKMILISGSLVASK